MTWCIKKKVFPCGKSEAHQKNQKIYKKKKNVNRNAEAGECASFRGSRDIVDVTWIVPPCHRAFVGPKLFFVGILWIQNIFAWVFCGSKIL